MSDGETYYVRRKGKVEGPWPIKKLHSEIKLKKLAKYHEASEDGKAWSRASEFDWYPKPKRPGGQSSDSGSAAGDADQPTGKAKWYVATGDEPQGPFSESELISRIQSKEVVTDDQVWEESFQDWKEVQNVDVFSTYLTDAQTAMTRIVTPTESNDVPAEDLPRSTMAILSIVSSLFFCIPIIPFVGLIFGFLGLNEIKKGQKSGKTMAILGMVLCLLSIVLFLILLISGIALGMVGAFST